VSQRSEREHACVVVGNGVAGVTEGGGKVFVIEKLLDLGDGVALAEALGSGNATGVHVDWPCHVLAQYLERGLSVRALGEQGREVRFGGVWCCAELSEQGVEVGWNGDPEWSLLERAVGCFVVGKDQDKVTEMVEELSWSEEVGGSRTGEKGEAPKGLGPVGSCGGEKLVHLSGGHGRGLPTGVAPLE